MKLKLFFNNKIIIEVVVKPEWKQTLHVLLEVARQTIGYVCLVCTLM